MMEDRDWKGERTWVALVQVASLFDFQLVRHAESTISSACHSAMVG